MKTDRFAILLPCDTIEGLSLDRPAAEARQLLTGWTAMWHPALLLAAGEIPTWHPAERPPDEGGTVLVLPECSRSLLPPGWLEGGEGPAPRVVPAGDDRQQLLAELLNHVKVAPDALDAIEGEMVADFLAVGFCYFLVELLTRQLRYMSNLDEAAFRTAVLAAAEEAGKGNGTEARRRLQSAFDLLGDAREYFYPVESRLLDLTLVAPTTLGSSLRQTLREEEPVNLLITGALVERLATEYPETLALLRERLEQKKAGLIGGEYEENPLPLLPPEAIRSHLERGLAAYERHLGVRPTIYGRRRFGLTPLLPPILRRLGFKGALHFTLDDGRFPAGTQSRIQWQGTDGRNFEAVARLPLDAACPESFLRLAERLGDVMDLDHSATAVFAHWPAGASVWYADLRRAARSARAVGAFTTIDEYFEQTAMAGQSVDYSPDQYQAPYLRQAVAAGEANPISRWVDYFRRRTAVEALGAMEAFAACTSGRIDPEAQAGLEQWVARIEQGRQGETDPALDAALEAARTDATRKLAVAIGFRVADEGAATDGALLLLNPHTTGRRVCLPWPEGVNLPDPAGAVRGADETEAGRMAVVDVPAMGFARVEPGSNAAPPEPEPERPRGWLRRKPKRKPEPPMAEQLDDRLVLRNEHCEVVFDQFTGAIRGISDYRTRGPRLAQQIALRVPDPHEPDPADDAHYTIQAADAWEITSAGPLVGEVRCRGRLVSRQGERMAGFRQTTRLDRGSRIVEIEIELEPDAEPGPNPWASYYAARFAWNDASANLYRSVGQLNFPTDANLLEAPHFVDIRTADGRTTLLCNGLPYHRRFGLRRLDSLLVVRGETARTFRLGVGLDVPHPVHAATDALLPLPVLPLADPGPSAGGWLFHLDHRNVLVTSWAPLPARPPEPAGKGVRSLLPERPEGCFAQKAPDPFSDPFPKSDKFGPQDYWEPEPGPPEVPPTGAGSEPPAESAPIDPSRLAGLRLRLLELDGRSTQLGLRLVRRPVRAEKLSDPGRPSVRLDIADDRIAIPLAAREWAEVEVWFESCG